MRSRPDRSLRQPHSFRPEGTGTVRKINDVVDGRDEFRDLRRGNHKRRGNLQNHEIVAANLSENVLVAEQTHDENLPEHGGMDLSERFKRRSQRQAPRRSEFNAQQEAFAADFLDHLVTAERGGQLFLQFYA